MAILFFLLGESCDCDCDRFDTPTAMAIDFHLPWPSSLRLPIQMKSSPASVDADSLSSRLPKSELVYIGIVQQHVISPKKSRGVVMPWFSLVQFWSIFLWTRNRTGSENDPSELNWDWTVSWTKPNHDLVLMQFSSGLNWFKPFFFLEVACM